MDQEKFVKGYLPQILLGPLLNTLSHMKVSLKVESLTSAEIHKKSMEINEIVQKGFS